MMTQSIIADSLIQRGIVNLQQKSLDAAVTSFTQALQHDSNSVCAYANRSIAYSIKGNYSQALDDLSRALELSPTHFALYFNRGMLYNRLGDEDRSIADFGKAIRLNPSGFWSYFNQTMILFRPDAPEDAQPQSQSQAESAAESQPQAGKSQPYPDGVKAEPLQLPHVPAFIPRGKLYKNLLKLHVAVCDFSHALEVQAHAAKVRETQSDALSLGLLFYARAIARNPKNMFFYWDRSFLFLETQQFTPAIADLSQAINHAPKHATLWANRGVIYYRCADFPNALSDFSESIACNPRMADAYANRAAAKVQLGQIDTAVTDLEKAMQLSPENPLWYRFRESLWV
ncbi:MAG TPA: tetratricopeptide repeat protein [Coleofasciculaceae cyanobacterium]|jgi:tetratricopeptide (TPR) repeat protein